MLLLAGVLSLQHYFLGYIDSSHSLGYPPSLFLNLDIHWDNMLKNGSVLPIYLSDFLANDDG
ncbi:hypothetical protein [Xenorhabdus szentirmaii]|uniref:Uncharacterized protein n=2 Tax=Xenorhabdus szentirmaii TaxID=290112 RepID=W1IV08_9GAMM|nr:MULTISPECIES: hypothetical protein [Xenorhabdus]MBD2781017.1 hypothetical protein [Xenorhabdus sp. 38]MBD2793194.1 hypothetical protein [Xenorhabdus sp. CUL]MBD2801718.1 hypothetical protein [Xenorhabdus sp. M]MBD2806000.1 hypothetical protein [Xenorhabdus sp. ZM]MBD2819842.1 hypothetical protein [Xenorhabdus sp. 42]